MGRFEVPWRTRLEPFGGDIVLAGALTVAAVSAASGLPPAEPTHAFLVLVVAVVTASLAVRRRYPVAVLALVTAATALFGLVYDGYWPFAALLAIYTAAAHCPRRRSIIAGGASIAILAVPIAAQIDWRPLAWGTIAHFAGSLAPLAAAWILGDNIRTRREYLRAVEDRAAQLEREQDANARRAAAEEQSRIAREVHDVVAHNLSVIVVQATGADAIFDADPADARRAVRSIGATARRALDELRLILGVVNDGDRRPALSLRSRAWTVSGRCSTRCGPLVSRSSSRSWVSLAIALGAGAFGLSDRAGGADEHAATFGRHARVGASAL